MCPSSIWMITGGSPIFCRSGSSARAGRPPCDSEKSRERRVPMKDGYARNIDYLRLSVTDRCNLRCQYCMPPEGVVPKRPDEILSYEELALIGKVAINCGLTKIRLTGGEPLVRKDLTSLVR